MNKAQVIKEMVQEFVKDEKLFTSIDVGNAIKRKLLSMEIRNRDVRDWLKTNINADGDLKDYVNESIDVNNGTQVATLYRPHWKDADDYQNRDQAALTPAEVDVLKDNAKGASQDSYGPSPIASAVASLVAAGTPVKASVDPSVNPPSPLYVRNDNSHINISDVFDDGTQLNSSVQIVRENKYARRIQIPGDITRALGWKPGQAVDLDKIKIHTGKLSPKLRVWPDGRCSIPRGVVGYGKAPVKIILKNDAVYFEKA